MINTDPVKIKEILERNVEEVIEKSHLEKALASGKKLRIKLGIDPTGPKIHLGRAMQFLKLAAFQELGHQIILIIGDFTAQIGDASDKQTMRKSLTEKEIKENEKTYQKQISKILDLKKTEIRHNSEWLNKLTFKDYFGLAKYFTVQQMIQRRNFKERWDRGYPIGLPELSYPVMQGYDSVMVKADVELGGSDQLFNLNTGRDIQKIFNQKPQDIMTLKMLYGLDSRKMSTSWGNVVNITDESADMFGKIMSMKDELILEYFELATKIPMAEVEKIKKELSEGKINPKDIKARLAKEITAIYHGEKATEKAEQEFNRVFRDKELPSDMPEFKTNEERISLLDLLFRCGLTKSKAEAKRLVMEGGVKIDSEKQIDWQKQVEIKSGTVIQAGKRKFVKIMSICK